jgi:hypothetical protein
MKKLIIILAIIVLCPFLAQAATVTWVHDGVNTHGYTIYFWETATPGNVYNQSIVGNNVREMVIDDVYFAPNVEYSFMGRAYNGAGQSEPSNTAVWTRTVDAYDPPQDSLPGIIVITNPAPVTIDVR